MGYTRSEVGKSSNGTPKTPDNYFYDYNETMYDTPSYVRDHDLCSPRNLFESGSPLIQVYRYDTEACIIKHP